MQECRRLTADEVLAMFDDYIKARAKKAESRYAYVSYLTASDYEQEARISVADAVVAYDPSITLPATYFIPRINWAICDAVRRSGWVSRKEAKDCQNAGISPRNLTAFSAINSAKERAYSSNGHSAHHKSTEDIRDSANLFSIINPACHAEPEHHDGAEAELIAMIRASGGSVSPSESRLIRWYFVRCLSLKQIAARLGVSESRTSQRFTVLLDRLRSEMKHHEYFHLAEQAQTEAGDIDVRRTRPRSIRVPKSAIR